MADTPETRFAALEHARLDDGRVLVKARSHRSRRRGLARMEPMAPTHALHIPSCPSVHTFGMRFALDLIWLGRDGSVVRIDRGVARRRMRWCPRARSVIETVAGHADELVAAGAPAAAARPRY